MAESKSAHEPAEVKKIRFSLISPDAPPGEWLSPQMPSEAFQIGKLTVSLAMLQDRDEVVIPSSSIFVRFSFPLAGDHLIHLETPDGKSHFTREALVSAISTTYAKIYADENATSTIPEGPHEKFIYNRNATDGTYGIRGHFLADLRLMWVVRAPAGEHYEMYVEG